MIFSIEIWFVALQYYSTTIITMSSQDQYIAEQRRIQADAQRRREELERQQRASRELAERQQRAQRELDERQRQERQRNDEMRRAQANAYYNRR